MILKLLLSENHNQRCHSSGGILKCSLHSKIFHFQDGVISNAKLWIQHMPQLTQDNSRETRHEDT